MARGQRNGRGNVPGDNGKSDDFAEDQPTRDVGNGHNSQRVARLEAEDKAVAEWCKLQDQEDALIEKHIAPIRKRKNKLKADLKSMHGVPTAAFNARASLRRIELTGDDEVVLATQEMFEATPVGKNLDLVAVAERVAKARAEKEAAKTKAKMTEDSATAH